MADIELVIKIPKKTYKLICDKNALGCGVGDIKNIIRNGAPLPKGHGRLIDADALKVSMGDDWKTGNEIANCIKSAPIIIESDKESDTDV